MRQLIDPYTILLMAMVSLAAALPAHGVTAHLLAVLDKIAVALLFFTHGAALSRQSVLAGATHWRLHLLIFGTTFICFPLVVLPINALAPAWIPSELALGFLYLGVLPSAVSSSIAFTAIAGGNVPASVCSSATSNVLGMMATPLLLVLLTQTADSHSLPVGEALRDIILQLLLPFAAGQLVHPWIGNWLHRHEALSSRYDQAVIMLIVYTAFSQSIVSGLWRDLSWSAIVIALVLCGVLLAAMIAFTMLLSRRLGFSRADETTVVFCGCKKSLASGLPMANVLFAGNPALGMIVLPIMIYNQLQVIVAAGLARHYARTLRATPRDAVARITT